MISEITEGEFLNWSGQRLKDSIVPNYYYRLDVGGEVYAFGTNAGMLKLFIKEFKVQSLLFLIYESNYYSFNTVTGEIIESSDFNDHCFESIEGSNYVYAFCELVVYKISIDSGQVCEIIYSRDVILGFEIINNKVVMDVFESDKLSIELE